MRKQDAIVIFFLFSGAFAGVVAAAGGDDVAALIKLVAAGYAAGAAATLAVLRPVGTSIRPTPQVEDEQREARVRQVREAGKG